MCGETIKRFILILPHGRGGVEREGGSCPPMGELSINLVDDTQIMTQIPLGKSLSGTGGRRARITEGRRTPLNP